MTSFKIFIKETSFNILIKVTSFNIFIKETSFNIFSKVTSFNIFIKETSFNILIKDTSFNIFFKETSFNTFTKETSFNIFFKETSFNTFIKETSFTVLISTVCSLNAPGFARLGLHLVDPHLVDLDGVGVDAQVAVLDDAHNQRVQHLPQRVLATLVPGHKQGHVLLTHSNTDGQNSQSVHTG